MAHRGTPVRSRECRRRRRSPRKTSAPSGQGPSISGWPPRSSSGEGSSADAGAANFLNRAEVGVVRVPWPAEALPITVAVSRANLRTVPVPKSRTAARADTTANCEKRSRVQAAGLEMLGGSNRVTCAAMRVLNRSLRTIEKGPMAERPSTRAGQKSSRVHPAGDTTPIPVITTRFMQRSSRP